MGSNWIGFPDGVNWTRNLLNVGTIKIFSIRMIDSMGLHFYLRLNCLEEIVVPVLQPAEVEFSYNSVVGKFIFLLSTFGLSHYT